MAYIYLASPYSDPDPHIRKRRHLAAEAAVHWLLSRHIWVYSPIVHCHFLAEGYELPKGIDFWRPYSFAMLRPAAALWVLRIPGHETSAGVKDETHFATIYGIPLGSITPNGPNYLTSMVPKELQP